MLMAERRLVLRWVRTADGGWHTLYGVDLAHPHFRKLGGVYVIWHDGPRASVVRLGQGVIRNRLTAHRINPSIESCDRLDGPLYVSWAAVPSKYRDAVEHYLALVLEPRVGSCFPTATPIPANLPWERPP